jgi:WD40 repeat protein
VVDGYDPGFYCHNVLAGGAKVLAGCGRKSKNICLVDLKNASDNPDKMGESPLLMEFNGPVSPVYCISAEKTANPTHFVAGAKNGHLSYHDMTKPEPVSLMEDIHEGVVYAVDMHQSGNQLCSASSDGLIQIADFRASGGWKATTTIEDAAASGVPYSVLWRGDRELVSCGDDYCVKRWDIRNLKQGTVENYLGHTSPVRKIAMSEDQKYVISAANDGGIRVWIIDERLYLTQEMDLVNTKIAKAEKQRLGFDKQLSEDAFSEEINEDELRKCVYDLEKSYRRSKYIHACRNEREAMSCVQASLTLEGHQLPITALAARTHPNDSNKIEIVSGSQDQTCMNYIVKKPKLSEFVRWSKDKEDEAEPVSP